MNAKRFTYLRHEVLKQQGVTGIVRPELEEITFHSKIAEGDNVRKLEKLLEENCGKEILMVAGTGTGKTFAVNQLCDMLAVDEFMKDTKDRKRIVNFLFVPNRAQAEQLGSEYKFRSVVGGVKYREIEKMEMGCAKYSFDGVSKAKLAVVYDKAEDIECYINRHPEYDYNLFVDEAHNLLSQYSFRQEAVEAVESLIKTVKAKNGCVLLMTATPYSLMFRRETISKVIECKGKEKVSKYDDIEIVCKKKSKDSLSDVVYSTIVQERTAGNRCFVRYNSFKDTGDISTRLRAENHYDVKVVSSKNKDYLKVRDSEGNFYNQYFNEIYNCFINKSSLPLADVWMTTSILDAGSSCTQIKKIGQDENLVAIFVVKDMRHLDISDMLQFSARIRFRFKKFIIILNRTEEDDDYQKSDKNEDETEEETCRERKKERTLKSIEDLAWMVSKQVDKTKSIVEAYAELMKLKTGSVLEIREGLQEFVQLENVAGFQNNMECIYIDSKGVPQIDETQKALVIYNLFNRQYYYKLQELKKLLEKESDCDSIEIKTAELVSSTFCPTDVLRNTLLDKSLLNQIYTNFLKEDGLKLIEHTTEYQQVQELIKIAKLIPGYKLTEVKIAENAVSAVCNHNQKKTKKNLLSLLVRKLETNEIYSMMSPYYDDSDDKVKKLLEKQGVIKLIKSLEILLGDREQAIEQFKKQGAEAGKTKKYISDNIRIYMNEMYLKNRDKLYGLDNAGRAHCIVLDITYELNEAGNMKKKTVNDKLLEEVMAALNKEFGEKAYGKQKVKNLISQIFNLQDKPKKLSSLKRNKKLIIKDDDMEFPFR